MRESQNSYNVMRIRAAACCLCYYSHQRCRSVSVRSARPDRPPVICAQPDGRRPPAQDAASAPGGAGATAALRRQLLARTAAVARLEEALDGAAAGRHQFLSGLLHNLAKILAPERAPADAFAGLEAAGLGPGGAALARCNPRPREQRLLSIR
jgi:hypothetical protein